MTLILSNLEQGSDEWKAAKAGCISAGKASMLLVGGKGMTRKGYINDVASEILSGKLSESVSTWDMERGILLEPFAILAYEAKTGTKVKRVGLGYLNEEKRILASPDGLIEENEITQNGGMEVKCQMAKNHLRTIMAAKNPDKFKAQLQFSMWIFDVEFWDYVSFCPEFKHQPLFIYRAIRDNKFIEELKIATEKAITEIDEIVATVKLEKENKAVAEICREANELIDILTDKDPGIT